MRYNETSQSLVSRRGVFTYEVEDEVVIFARLWRVNKGVRDCRWGTVLAGAKAAYD